MATLARKRKLMFIDPRTVESGVTELERFGLTTINIFYIVVVGGLIASATGTVAYLVYSGFVTQSLARVLVSACRAVGNCTDFSALLSSLAASLMILVVVGMVLLSGLASAPEPKDEPAADLSQATLLLNWYCLSSQSREVLLKLLETSDADVAEGVVYMLRNEHESMQEVMRGGG